MIENVIRYYGNRETPRNIVRRRRQVMEALRRFGTPVLIKHMYNVIDVNAGEAAPSANRNDVYGQTRHNDPLSHGVGFTSVEVSDDEWVSPDGLTIVKSKTSPGSGYTQAPKYRGYGPGFLTYVIFPDVAEDFFRVTETGVLIKVQDATVQMGWYPDVNDNDLMIACIINRNEQIIETKERYLLKMVNPVSMRGLDRGGRREYTEDWGNRFVVNQSFNATLLPANDELYKVETDR